MIQIVPEREEIESRYKWNLADIYQNQDLWENEFKKVKKMVKLIAKYKGTLGQNARCLFECLSLRDELFSLSDTLSVYAILKSDEDNSNFVSQALVERISTLTTEIDAATSFVIAEINSIPETVRISYMEQEPRLQVYQHFFKELARQKEHTLSEREEEIIALTGNMANGPGDIFNMFSNADLEFRPIQDENGAEVEITKGTYLKYLESANQRVRKDAYYSFCEPYRRYGNTLAATLISHIKTNQFYAGVRNYGSSFEAALDVENITPNVYENLIRTINGNLGLLHRYFKLCKRALNLEMLNIYDLFAPLTGLPGRRIEYEDALAIVESSLKVMGDEYVGYLRIGFHSGWIDVYENQGKSGGAYSCGAYKTHPYVFLNYQGTLNDVFTIAHEMGHALHTYYTNKSQPYIYSEYDIFVAEVASIVNETLLIKYLLQNVTDRSEEIYVLSNYLVQFWFTVFKQVMLAEFENTIHGKIEQGEALTKDDLCQIYAKLNRKYFGSEVLIDEDANLEWARISHFYDSFYVYKYATGYAAATSIANQILHEGPQAVERYLCFLRSGCSSYPLELLKTVGIDLTSPKPIEEALKLFEETLARLERLFGDHI